MRPPERSSEPGAPPPAPDELARLRELLLEPERERLEALERRPPPEKLDARALAELLPDAVLVRSARDERLAAALAPTVERGLEASARRNPGVLADAIFPVLGPAVRKAIQAALAGALQSIELALENSLSPASLRGRWNARRAGVSYAEYLLARSLVYRVEQAFLVHRETGLLLEQALLPGVEARDADLVSAMMTAVSDFVGDSFGTEEGDGLAQIDVGGTRLAVAQGPRAVLAVVVRGTPPASLQTTLDETLERIHLDRAADLAGFAGDATPFRAARLDLEAILQERRRERARSAGAGFALPALLLALAFLGVRAVLAWSAWRRAWDAAVARVDAEPGYVVLEAERGRRRVRGLRDPLARPVDEVLAGAGPEEIAWEWEAFQASDGPIALARARSLLAPPPEVELSLAGGKLVARGRAGAGWVRELRARWSAIPGIAALDDARLVDADAERCAKLAARLGAREVPWEGPEPGGAAVEAALALIGELDASALASGQRPLIEVRGLREAGEEGALADRRAAAFAAAVLRLRPRQVELRALPAGERPGLGRGVLLEALPLAPSGREDDAR